MFGGLLGQLQNQFRQRQMASPVGAVSPSTAANQGLMQQAGMSASGFTPNYTGLLGIPGMQPALFNSGSGGTGEAQGDYLSRVMAGLGSGASAGGGGLLSQPMNTGWQFQPPAWYAGDYSLTSKTPDAYMQFLRDQG